MRRIVLCDGARQVPDEPGRVVGRVRVQLRRSGALPVLEGERAGQLKPGYRLRV